MNNVPQPLTPPDDAADDDAAASPASIAAMLKQRQATAYHEAGHAVMAVSVGRSIQKVTIAPGKLSTGGMRLGICEIQKGRAKASRDSLEDDVLILLAGMVAEARFTGQYCPRGAAQDLQAARRLLATRAGRERQVERLERRLLDKTEHLLNDPAHVAAMESVVAELVQKTTISGRAVRHFFSQASAQYS